VGVRRDEKPAIKAAAQPLVADKPGRAVPAPVVETKRRAVSAMRGPVDEFRAGTQAETVSVRGDPGLR
jgi:hypothetical protein